MNTTNGVAFLKHISRVTWNRVVPGAIGLACAAIAACDDAAVDSPASSPAAAQSPATQASGDISYSYNTKISFVQGGGAARYQVSGWSHAEPEGTWTDGNSAKLAFAVPPSDKDVVLKATVSGFTKTPVLPTQPVDVFINGEQTTHWEIAAKGLVQLLIPAKSVQDGKLELEFKLSKVTSPASLGVSGDQRKLGLRFYDLEIVKP